MVFSELIAVYLFCGGTAAGAFALFSCIELFAAATRGGMWRARVTAVRRRDHGPSSATWRRIATAVYGAALVTVVVGMLCLLADLGRPEAFYLLFLHPTSSLVSIGAFALAILTVCIVVALAASALALGRVGRRAALVAKAVGAVTAVVVMVYTGLLLEAVVAVSLWRSAWLPVLFLLSALSCGCAVVLACVGACEDLRGMRAWSRALSALDAGIIALEAIAAVACAVTVGVARGSDALAPLLAGDQAAAFWIGFVGCGMLAPLAIEVASIASRRAWGSARIAAVAVLILVGGFCLRFALVGAGAHPVL